MYHAKHSRYTYPGTNIIRNKLGIRNAKKLKEVDKKIVEEKLQLLRKEPLPEKWDIAHIKKIHRFLFEELYDFAGDYRLENITKENFIFAPYPYLEENLDLILNKIKIDEFAKLPKEELIIMISYLMTELNVLHPFRERKWKNNT